MWNIDKSQTFLLPHFSFLAYYFILCTTSSTHKNARSVQSRFKQNKEIFPGSTLSYFSPLFWIICVSWRCTTIAACVLGKACSSTLASMGMYVLNMISRGSWNKLKWLQRNCSTQKVFKYILLLANKLELLCLSEFIHPDNARLRFPLAFWEIPFKYLTFRNLAKYKIRVAKQIEHAVKPAFATKIQHSCTTNEVSFLCNTTSKSKAQPIVGKKCQNIFIISYFSAIPDDFPVLLVVAKRICRHFSHTHTSNCFWSIFWNSQMHTRTPPPFHPSTMNFQPFCSSRKDLLFWLNSFKRKLTTAGKELPTLHRVRLPLYNCH